MLQQHSETKKGKGTDRRSYCLNRMEKGGKLYDGTEMLVWLWQNEGKMAPYNALEHCEKGICEKGRVENVREKSRIWIKAKRNSLKLFWSSPRTYLLELILIVFRMDSDWGHCDCVDFYGLTRLYHRPNHGRVEPATCKDYKSASITTLSGSPWILIPVF